MIRNVQFVKYPALVRVQISNRSKSRIFGPRSEGFLLDASLNISVIRNGYNTEDLPDNWIMV